MSTEKKNVGKVVLSVLIKGVLIGVIVFLIIKFVGWFMPRTPGAKNKKPAEGRKTFFKTFSISASFEEAEKLKELAKKEGKTLSRYLIDLALNQK